MLKKIGLVLCLLLTLTSCRRHHDTIEVFPLDHYDQDISHWIKPTDSHYATSLMNDDTQKQHVLAFFNHYFGSASPWNPTYVKKILQASRPDDLKTTEASIIKLFNNTNKSEKEIGYGENFRAYSSHWLERISANIPISQFDHLQYDPKNRAIALDNTAARVLPTDDVFFFHHKIAGQGYPFDNLQMSALWAGTPVYILGKTHDGAWSLVITPDYIAWVKSLAIARADADFIKKWVNTSLKNAAAITHTKTSIVDANGVFRFSAYVGSFFPVKENKNTLKIFIPVANEKHQATLSSAVLPEGTATLMPFSPTPQHFSKIMSTLLGRPYGWGNMYFYNDCSAELKSLFTPFGIWLPRHSSDQVYVGKFTDLSTEKQNKRLDFLMNQGQPFTTLVYIGGHVLLFIGNYPNPHSKKQELMAMSFQNMWGLKPNPSTRRAVIGKSVLFPILPSYPEDKSLVSQAGKSYFQVSQLDEASNNLKLQIIDLKDLMYP